MCRAACCSGTAGPEGSEQELIELAGLVAWSNSTPAGASVDRWTRPEEPLLHVGMGSDLRSPGGDSWHIC